MVIDGRSNGHPSAIQPEEQPCRRCYYDNIPCYKQHGRDGECTKCASVERSCFPDLTGIKPYVRKKGHRPGKVLRDKGKAPKALSSDGTATELDVNNSESEQKHHSPAFEGGVRPEREPCRSCYYEGVRCYKDRGLDRACLRCTLKRMRCQASQKSGKPYDQRPGKNKIDAVNSIANAGANTQHEKPHDDEAVHANAGSEREDPTEEIANTRYGVRDRLPRAHAVAQKQRIESLNTKLEMGIKDEMEMANDSSGDPLVIWSAWLPTNPPAAGRCPPETRPCRRCSYEGHYCYKSRGPDEVCDTCFGRNN